MDRDEIEKIEIQNQGLAQKKRKEYEKIIANEISKADRILEKAYLMP